MIKLSLFGSNIGTNVSNIFVNAFIDDLISHNCVEEHIEFYNDSFKVIFLIGILFSDEKSVFLLEYVLDFTDYMRSPDYLPVFL